MSYLTPIAEAHLAPLMEAASTAAAARVRDAFLAGAALGPRAVFLSQAESVDQTPFELWKAETLRRYRVGTWKHSIVDLVPAPTFRPSEIYTGRREELMRRHPDHNNHGVGTHNTINDLIRDGVLVKLADGAGYGAAIGGHRVADHANNDSESQFRGFLQDVERRVIDAAPQLLDAHLRECDLWGHFQHDCRFVILSQFGHDRVLVSGAETIGTTIGGRPARPEQLFPNRGVAISLRMNDGDCDLLSRAIVAWLTNDRPQIASVRRSVGVMASLQIPLYPNRTSLAKPDHHERAVALATWFHTVRDRGFDPELDDTLQRLIPNSNVFDEDSLRLVSEDALRKLEVEVRSVRF